MDNKPTYTVSNPVGRIIEYPVSVSYHGSSTILVDSTGQWVTQQVPRDKAEQIAQVMNDQYVLARLAEQWNPLID